MNHSILFPLIFLTVYFLLNWTLGESVTEVWKKTKTHQFLLKHQMLTFTVFWAIVLSFGIILWYRPK